MVSASNISTFCILWCGHCSPACLICRKRQAVAHRTECSRSRPLHHLTHSERRSIWFQKFTWCRSGLCLFHNWAFPAVGSEGRVCVNVLRALHLHPSCIPTSDYLWVIYPYPCRHVGIWIHNAYVWVLNCAEPSIALTLQPAGLQLSFFGISGHGGSGTSRQEPSWNQHRFWHNPCCALLSSTHQRSTLCSVHLVGVQGTAALGAGGGSAENRNPVQP